MQQSTPALKRTSLAEWDAQKHSEARPLHATLHDDLQPHSQAFLSSVRRNNFSSKKQHCSTGIKIYGKPIDKNELIKETRIRKTLEKTLTIKYCHECDNISFHNSVGKKLLELPLHQLERKRQEGSRNSARTSSQRKTDPLFQEMQKIYLKEKNKEQTRPQAISNLKLKVIDKESQYKPHPLSVTTRTKSQLKYKRLFNQNFKPENRQQTVSLIRKRKKVVQGKNLQIEIMQKVQRKDFASMAMKTDCFSMGFRRLNRME